MSKDYLELPMKDIKGVKYNDPFNHPTDDLERFFKASINADTGFSIDKIHIFEAKKTKYKRHFNYFKFEYEGKIYILENGIKKEDND